MHGDARRERLQAGPISGRVASFSRAPSPRTRHAPPPGETYLRAFTQGPLASHLAAGGRCACVDDAAPAPRARPGSGEGARLGSARGLGNAGSRPGRCVRAGRAAQAGRWVTEPVRFVRGRGSPSPGSHRGTVRGGTELKGGATGTPRMSRARRSTTRPFRQRMAKRLEGRGRSELRDGSSEGTAPVVGKDDSPAQSRRARR